MIFLPAAQIAEGLAFAGSLELLAGAAVVSRFVRGTAKAQANLPPMTVLKPLAGDEPRLEEALASFCAQDYPDFHIVFGVQDPADPAIAVVKRLRERFPERDIALVIDRRKLGPNRKIGNLLNMIPLARHELLVISDSDIHAEPDLLRSLAGTLAQPRVGIATCLYGGLPASDALAARLGATQISHVFLPGALLARTLGRQDCLGAVMALRRSDLEAIGGLDALLPYLADDAVLGQKIVELGKKVELAHSVVATTVPESSISALWQHELRWARTIRALAPAGFAASLLQYPLFFAMVAILTSGEARWALACFAALWLLRGIAAAVLDRRLGLKPVHGFLLLPLRDLISALMVPVAFLGDKVQWRGESLSVLPPALTKTANGATLFRSGQLYHQEPTPR